MYLPYGCKVCGCSNPRHTAVCMCAGPNLVRPAQPARPAGRRPRHRAAGPALRAGSGPAWRCDHRGRGRQRAAASSQWPAHHALSGMALRGPGPGTSSRSSHRHAPGRQLASSARGCRARLSGDSCSHRRQHDRWAAASSAARRLGRRGRWQQLRPWGPVAAASGS